MDKVLRPDRFDVEPNDEKATKQWRHWYQTFGNFLRSIDGQNQNLNKLDVLTNFVSPEVYELFCDADTYDAAIATLKRTYDKQPNEIFARHKLSTRKQQNGETLDSFMQALQSLSKDCQFRAVSANEYREEAVRDAFINGLHDSEIRQRLLENRTLDLETAFGQARAMDLARQNSEFYQSTSKSTSMHFNAAEIKETDQFKGLDKHELAVTSPSKARKCYFCGSQFHIRAKCPAKEAVCHLCKKVGHYARVCQSTKQKSSAFLENSQLATLLTCSAKTHPLAKSCINIMINGSVVNALVDSGSTDNFINPKQVERLSLTILPSRETVSMASSSLSAKMKGYCSAIIVLHDHTYENVKLYVLPNLCADVILGQNWQSNHESVRIKYGGERHPLKICNLTTLNVSPPPLFENLDPNCKPIITKSRRYSDEDRKFITEEVERLLSEGIIEPSNSPWRAQVVVTRNERHKKRLVIDFSQTINKFTYLDAYPLPNLNETVNTIAQYRVYSVIDLKSAYHQVPLQNRDKKYRAFEANGRLYQFCRIPFGVTNGVSAFRRTIDSFIAEEGLTDTFAYLDDVTICGNDQEHHDKNFKKFLDAATRRNLTLNQDKCVFSTRKIALLGYVLSEGEIRPDPERLQPLKNLPRPNDMASQKRILEMFAYYSQWIRDFSAKIKPLVQNTSFPLSKEALSVFYQLKSDIELSVVCAVDETAPFQVETDASEFALAATLSQKGRPVAFFSRTLSKTEQKHSAVEKEAAAIVEAVRKWKHYPYG